MAEPVSLHGNATFEFAFTGIAKKCILLWPIVVVFEMLSHGVNARKQSAAFLKFTPADKLT